MRKEMRKIEGIKIYKVRENKHYKTEVIYDLTMTKAIRVRMPEI